MNNNYNKKVVEAQEKALSGEITEMFNAKKKDSELLEAKKEKFAKQIMKDGFGKEMNPEPNNKIKQFFKRLINTIL